MADETLVIPAVLLPRGHDATQHAGYCGRHGFDGKFEARTVGEVLRQAGDDAGYFDIVPLPCGWQFLSQADVGPPRRPGETQCHTGKNPEDAEHRAQQSGRHGTLHKGCACQAGQGP